MKYEKIGKKVGLKTKFHDPGTSGGFGKCGQTHTDKIHVL